MLNGILWILRTGAPWADLPTRYPSHQTCHRRFQRGVRDGVLRTLLEILALAFGGLLAAGDGFFYGTSYGDVFRFGSIFRVSPAGDLVTLHAFGLNDAIHPAATLTLAPDGAMYGSTVGGGNADGNGGTLFRLVPAASGVLLPKKDPGSLP